MSASLGELALAWEPHFRLERFEARPDHYVRTFRAWNLALRADRERAAALVDAPTLRLVERYLAAGEALFRLGEQTLYRVVLRRRPTPKVWRIAAAPRPAPRGWRRGCGPPGTRRVGRGRAGALRPLERLLRAVARPVDGLLLGAVAGRGRRSRAGDGSQGRGSSSTRWTCPLHGRLLDVGCGWGAALALALRERPGLDAVGLTLSAAQREHCERRPRPARRGTARGLAGARARPPATTASSASAPSSTSRGTARRSVERVAGLPALLRRLPHLAGARRAARRSRRSRTTTPPTPPRRQGRGPLGDAVLELFPESFCPHLAEIVLGFEPWFRLEVLRSDAADFARTFRAWSLRLRGHEARGGELVGADVVRAFRRYLASSEVQFRTGTLTNYRLVLRRRDTPHDDRRRRDGPGPWTARSAITSLCTGPPARGRQEQAMSEPAGTSRRTVLTSAGVVGAAGLGGAAPAAGACGQRRRPRAGPGSRWSSSAAGSASRGPPVRPSRATDSSRPSQASRPATCSRGSPPAVGTALFTAHATGELSARVLDQSVHSLDIVGRMSVYRRSAPGADWLDPGPSPAVTWWPGTT